MAKMNRHCVLNKRSLSMCKRWCFERDRGILDLPDALYSIVAILTQGLENVCFPGGAI